MLDESTADPSTSLRFGRDDNSFIGWVGVPKKDSHLDKKGHKLCKSAGAPNEQKIKPMESISISGVHFPLNLPQASQLLGMTKEGCLS
jgi:hypothetical protein